MDNNLRKIDASHDIWYLYHSQAVKMDTSHHKCSVLPEPSLFALTSRDVYKVSAIFMPLSPLDTLQMGIPVSCTTDKNILDNYELFLFTNCYMTSISQIFAKFYTCPLCKTNKFLFYFVSIKKQTETTSNTYA